MIMDLARFVVAGKSGLFLCLFLKGENDDRN